MLRLLPILLCVSIATVLAEGSGFGRPATIASSELDGFDELPEDRRKLLAAALRLASESPWLRYKEAGSTPADGGFDCSGAVSFVLRSCGHAPPRSSAGQWKWLKENGRLHEVPATANDLEDPVFRALKPGDLLFWARGDENPPRINHVAIYLGREKKDGLRVMINSTDGRSYRGRKANGYGVYDFRLASSGANVRFVGFGTPPGIAAEK